MCLNYMSLGSRLQCTPAFLKLGSASWADSTPYNMKLLFLRFFLPILSSIAATSIKTIFSAIGVNWGGGCL